MKIKLSEIHAAPQPVRTTWDEDRLDELAQSIQEQGLIVPIKVRPNGAGYEVVYGHRRVEAAKRAGLREIESIVEGMDDTNALTQALIENVQREDMEPMDIANSLAYLQEITDWSQAEIGRRRIMPQPSVTRYLSLIKEEPEIQRLIARASPRGDVPEGKITERHIRYISGVDLDPVSRKQILKKAAAEGMSSEQSYRAAAAVGATKDPRRRRMLLETPYSSFIHDPDMNRERAERYGAHDPMSVSKEPSIGEMWEMTTEVKMILDYLKSSRKMAQEALKMDEVGKFSPEARLFVARKARRMVEAWQGVVDKLGAEP
jgi:ParB family chromosome partitioning protein